MAHPPTSLPVPAAKRDTAASAKLVALLAKADIRINGPRPWDMRVHTPGTLDHIATGGSIALGESYMDGAWDAGQLDEFFTRVLRARLYRQVKPTSLLLPVLRDRLLNRQNKRRAWRIGRAHYDLGNNFYQAMLGPSMTYSCGYWKDATTLAAAQTAKLDLICRKLQLAPGMRVLDIGSGWGSFMAHAAKHYGVRCVGVTVSKEQADYCNQHYPGLPLEFQLEDYRNLGGKFDRIASIGMFEHVGKKNHRTFMQVARRCLADDGIFLLHTIGKNEHRGITDPWTEKYIFPNAELPAISHIADAMDGLFVTEDLHNFGADYDRTLMEWHKNFEAAWPRFADSLGGRFHRQWKYYLLSSAGAFRARDLQVWQWTLTKNGLPGGCPRIS